MIIILIGLFFLFFYLINQKNNNKKTTTTIKKSTPQFTNTLPTIKLNPSKTNSNKLPTLKIK